MALQAWQPKGRPLRLGVDTALALCNHFLTFRICRCLDAKSSCKIRKASYSLTNNCYRRHDYYDSICSGGRTPPGNLTQLWLWMFRRWWQSSWSVTTIQTWCARCNLRESSHGEVLCDATNETAVGDMLCRDNKEMCKYFKENYSIWDTWRSQEEAGPSESLTVVNLLLDIFWSSSRTPNFPGHPFGPRSFLHHA
jgi:hypothetical protein